MSFEFAILGLGFVAGALFIVLLWCAGRPARLAYLEEKYNKGFAAGYNERGTEIYNEAFGSMIQALERIESKVSTIRIEVDTTRELIHALFAKADDQEEMLVNVRRDLQGIHTRNGRIERNQQSLSIGYGLMIAAIAAASDSKQPTDLQGSVAGKKSE